jgi:hypothetical protein
MREVSARADGRFVPNRGGMLDACPACMPTPVFRDKPPALQSAFGCTKAVVGVIHAPALPGSPDYDGTPVAELYEIAVAGGQRYRAGDIDRPISKTTATSRSPIQTTAAA